MMITLYTKPSCVQCNMTKKKLESLGLNYRTIDVTEDEQALEFVKGMGYLAAPVVVIGFDHPTMGGQHWAGYQPDKLSAIVQVPLQ